MTGRSGRSRREVLRLLAAGGATLLAGGVGVGGYRGFDTAAPHPGGGQAYDPWERWRDTPGPLGAVAAAILASNPHDTQSWRSRVVADAVDVFIDPARHSGSLDPDHREQHVGLGCACENLALACRAPGLRPDVVLLPDGPDATRVAHVGLVPGPTETDARYAAIGSRHTNRGPSRRGP